MFKFQAEIEDISFYAESEDNGRTYSIVISNMDKTDIIKATAEQFAASLALIVNGEEWSEGLTKDLYELAEPIQHHDKDLRLIP